MLFLKITVSLSFLLSCLHPMAQDASTAPYRGGIADGYHLQAKTNFAYSTDIIAFAPFKGSIADGYASDSLLVFDPRGQSLLFSPFAGGVGDGFATDSIIRFTQDYITMFSPFGGSVGDGYAMDSMIVFNPRDYIALYTPYGGGIADGYHEAVICNFPQIDGDTTLFLLCADNQINLDSLVMNYNFAGRWSISNPESVGPGVYELRINNAGKCLDTAIVNVKLDVVKWLGSIDNNWHNPANWNTGTIPTAYSHVIVSGGTPHPCEIFEKDAEAASVQANTSAIVRTIGERKLFINGTCASLPAN